MGNDFIIARDREAVVPVILSYPSRRIVCGELRLTGIPEASPNLEVLRAYAAARGIRAR
jgi:hypothetical protein